VLAPNYRGSTGYGPDFRAASVRDLGGGDYQDIQAGVDYLIAKGSVDPKNLFLAGWSYGGYMTAWTIGQDTRYNAAAEGNGLTDLLSFSGTSDIPFYSSVYLGTMYWDDAFLYVKRSPVIYVKNIQTPLLILSGQKDIRVPVEQSLEMYTALKRLHKPVKMIVFPDQTHVPSDADIALDAITEINAWFAGRLRK
jgi:dipeptidyl aminopeptidase/acylaminoacyl peptidase